MNSKTRSVAVLGGNRIPFARSNGAYAKASNQDMLTAALEGLVDRFSLAGETMGEMAAGAVLKHSRDFNLTRENASSARSSRTRPRRTTSARPAGRGSRPRSSSPTRSRSGRSTRRSRAASTRHPTRRSRSTMTSARSCWRRTTRSRTSIACARSPKIRPNRIVPEIPRNAEPRTGLSMEAHCDHGSRVGGHSRGTRRVGRREPSEPRRRL